MLYYERKFKKKGFDLIIGVDEAGRGPLAGPVVAAAVTLLSTCFKNRIDDSKKLTPAEREKAYFEIINKSVYGLGIISEKVIDSLNILVATRIAMEKAVQSLSGKIKGLADKRVQILIDGNQGIEVDYPFTCIIKGDAKSKSIASASILAKVTRDRIMCLYDKIYPGYGFSRHKGYPTKLHKLAIKNKGLSLIHRVTFNSV